MTLARPRSSSAGVSGSRAASNPRASRSGDSSSEAQRTLRPRPEKALTSRLEASTGLESGAPGTVMPYSVSMPMTLVMAIRVFPPRAPRGRSLQVLPGVDLLDGAPEVLGVAALDQGAHVHDALALLARDARPVVGVGGVGQVLVLLELVGHGDEQVGRLDALLAGLQEPLDGHLLGPVDDVLDHRPGVEVLEVQDLLVAVGVGD